MFYQQHVQTYSCNNSVSETFYLSSYATTLVLKISRNLVFQNTIIIFAVPWKRCKICCVSFLALDKGQCLFFRVILLIFYSTRLSIVVQEPKWDISSLAILWFLVKTKKKSPLSFHYELAKLYCWLLCSNPALVMG